MSANSPPPGWPFDAVLIANRGEIAVRILRTVQRLGMRGVVVYHAADRATLAVRMADQAIELCGSTPLAAYLDAGQILAAGKAAGAGAIHPGYGFLSENASFARMVEAADMVFVGPAPEQIELMGDKVRARFRIPAARDPARCAFPCRRRRPMV
jgi:acetyl-CoA/propionyl-CoA carboxylase biotin carboxyl carrier protein